MPSQYFLNVFWHTETSLVIQSREMLFPFLAYNTIHLCKILQGFSGKKSRHLTKFLAAPDCCVLLDEDQYGRCLKCCITFMC